MRQDLSGWKRILKYSLRKSKTSQWKHRVHCEAEGSCGRSRQVRAEKSTQMTRKGRGRTPETPGEQSFLTWWEKRQRVVRCSNNFQVQEHLGCRNCKERIPSLYKACFMYGQSYRKKSELSGDAGASPKFREGAQGAWFLQKKLLDGNISEGMWEDPLSGWFLREGQRWCRWETQGLWLNAIQCHRFQGSAPCQK